MKSRTTDRTNDLSDLRPGDILIFRPPDELSMIQKMITNVQSIITKTQGNYDSTHVAICVGIENDKPIIAHLTGHDVMGYKKEPLENMLVRDGGDRAFFAFRPKDHTVADKLAQVAAADTNKDIKWKVGAAASILTWFSDLDRDRKITVKKEFDKDSFCSKFVIQALKVATEPFQSGLLKDVSDKYYPHIRSTSSPKVLEDYLNRDENYTKILYMGKKSPYEVLKQAITTELKTLMHEDDTKSQMKYDLLQKNFYDLTARLDVNNSYDDYQKTTILLHNILPILQIPTNMDIREPESYRKVIEAARRIGILESDIKNAPNLSSEFTESTPHIRSSHKM